MLEYLETNWKRMYANNLTFLAKLPVSLNPDCQLEPDGPIRVRLRHTVYAVARNKEKFLSPS